MVETVVDRESSGGGLLVDLSDSGELFVLRLADHGVPEDAKVLQVAYTPQAGGNLIPAEFHRNAPPRHQIPHTLYLYPVPFAKETPRETKVITFVVWVPHTADDYAWQSLVDAFEAYATGRYPAMIIPANVAVESALGGLMARFFFKHASRKNVEAFLREATYAHQLNVILLTLLSSSTAPPLPSVIRGLQNKLCDLRHQMAHEGWLDKDLDPNEAAGLLCAVLFGFRYVNLVRPTLLPEAHPV